MELTSVAVHDIKVKLITSLSEMNSLRPFWDSMNCEWSVDYELFSLVVQNRPNVYSPCIIVLFRKENPIALLVGRMEKANLPIRFGYLTLADIPVTRFVFVHGGFMGERTTDNWKLLLNFVDSVMCKHKIELATFESLCENSIELEGMKQLSSFARFCPVKESSKHWLLLLPKSWDVFLKNRSSKHRYWLNRLPKVLDHEFSGDWSIQVYKNLSEARQFIDAAEVIASTTYQRSIGVGFRRDVETLNRIELDARRGHLRAYLLLIKGEPKAFWYSFIYGRTLHMAATGYDPSYRKYELGTVLLMKVLQDHCGAGIEVIDFGLGDADYKRRFGTDYFEETSYNLFSKTSRGMCLQVFHSTMFHGTKLVKKSLDCLQITQRLKTRWRRRLEGKLIRSVDSQSHSPLDFKE